MGRSYCYHSHHNSWNNSWRDNNRSCCQRPMNFPQGHRPTIVEALKIQRLTDVDADVALRCVAFLSTIHQTPSEKIVRVDSGCGTRSFLNLLILTMDVNEPLVKLQKITKKHSVQLLLRFSLKPVTFSDVLLGCFLRFSGRASDGYVRPLLALRACIFISPGWGWPDENVCSS